MKTRVNISIEESTLDELDYLANESGCNRSKYIEKMVLNQGNIVRFDDDRFLKVCKFADELDEIIHKEEDYDKRQQLKSDAFYQLIGFMSAYLEND